MLEPLLRGADRAAPLVDQPIVPEWIEAGEPKARCAVLARTDDHLAMTVHWDCTAGRFTWLYSFDETIYILEGGCTLKQQGVPEIRLGPGDCAHVSRGAAVTWTVDSYVRKIGFCKTAAPRPIGHGIGLAKDALRRLWALAHGRSGAAQSAFGSV
jgi:uncharacterized cupin superfamily protein